jgi:hypothetical protein
LSNKLSQAAVLAALTIALLLSAQTGRAAEADAPSSASDIVVRPALEESAPGRIRMTVEELRSVPGSLGDPLRGLQSLPGVAVANDGAIAPAIRGSRPEDNSYYVDGIPAGRLFHVGGLISTLYPDLVSRFDLFSAAFGARFGNATGAVIDVGLRRPRTDRIGGELDISLLSGNVLLEGPIGPNQSFFLAGKRSYIDLFVKQVPKSNSDDGVIVQIPKYHDYLGKYFWRMAPAHELTLSFSATSDRLDLEIPSNSKLAAQEPVLVGTGRLRGSEQTQAIALNSALGSGLFNRLVIGKRLSSDDTQIGSALNVQVRQTDQFLIDRIEWDAAEHHKLSVGFELHSVRSRIGLSVRDARCTEFAADCDLSTAPLFSTQEDLRVNSSQFHLQHRWQFAPRWALTTGLHHSRDQYLGRSDTEPRLNLAYQWSPELSTYGAWGRHNQFPDAAQVLPTIGNPNLDHLHATHSVLGMTRKFADGWSLSTEIYRKALKDLVVADALQNYVNAGSGSARGLELLLRRSAAPERSLSGWLALSWAASTRRNDLTGQEFRSAYDQPLIINAVANYALPNRWQVGVKWSYHTGQPDTPIVDTGTYPDGRTRPIYGSLNSDRLPAYHRLDVRASRQVSREFSYYFELINAYARKNVSGYSYSADYRTRTPVLQLGLTPSFGVNFKF